MNTFKKYTLQRPLANPDSDGPTELNVILLTTVRAWREVARELVSETERERIIQLNEELGRALEEQGFDQQPRISPQEPTATSDQPKKAHPVQASQSK